MELLDDLPEDAITVLIETLCLVSKVSVVVFAHVNKHCYQISKRCALEFKINKKLLCHEIALEGSLEVLKWAMSNGDKWDTKICSHAARNGHFDVLKWARMNGCEWNHMTCFYAASSGYLDIL